MEETKFCESCGNEIKSNWVYCIKCGKKRSKHQPSQCTRCFQIIDDPQPVFCPYCQKKVDITKPVTPEPVSIVPPIRVSEEVVLTELIVSDFKVSIKTLLSNLRFDKESTIQVVNSSSFSTIAVVLIFLAGISNALSSYIIDFLSAWESGVRLNLYIGNFIMQFSLLITLAIFANILISILQKESSFFHFFRLMGGYAPLLILKDVLILPLSFYINIFQSDGYYLAGLIYLIGTFVIYIFVFIHLLVFLRSITGTELGISLILTICIYIMAITFVMGYVIPFVELLSDNIL